MGTSMLHKLEGREDTGKKGDEFFERRGEGVARGLNTWVILEKMGT